MFTRIGLGCIATLILAGVGWVLWVDEALTPASSEVSQDINTPQFSGPYVHENLTVCLIHGADSIQGRNFLLLDEALAQKKLVIHETRQANELAMKNLGDTEVIILSGDIVKGGQQDRIAQYDQIVPAKSGKMPLNVFCVEHTASRWNQPMTEKDKYFTSSPGRICSNNLRLASRYYMNQSAVWSDVAGAQDKLIANARASVKAKESDSSLALSLKASAVQQATDRYVERLAGCLDGKTDVIGYAFAVNGKVVSSEVYGSAAIFRKAWPRLLRASAIEAFAELPRDGKCRTADAQAFRGFLKDCRRANAPGTTPSRVWSKWPTKPGACCTSRLSIPRGRTCCRVPWGRTGEWSSHFS